MMGKWGNCDYRELERLQKSLDEACKQAEGFCRECAYELSQRLRTLAVKRTPVGKIPEGLPEEAKKYWKGYTGGELRRNWRVGEIHKSGDTFWVEVSNALLYASYVEYGHRQQPGRYVPALGKRLKSAWSPGRFMMTLSARDIERMSPALLEKKLQKFLERCLNGQ